MTADLLKAALLGAVQGLTEFLPVSSTGHLVLVEHYLGVDQERYGLSFDAALHLGTLLSLLFFFGNVWLSIASQTLDSIRRRSLAHPDARLGWLIALGTIPAALFGFLLESTIEESFRSPELVAIMLILFSLPFVAAERLGRQRREDADLSWADSVWVGLAQAVALIPGVSRSGITISTGLLRHQVPHTAARFAFLLSAPIIAGAGLKQLLDAYGEYRGGLLDRSDAAFFGVGLVVSAIVGYAAIAFLMRFVTDRGLMPFVYYRVALGVTVLSVAGITALA